MTSSCKTSRARIRWFKSNVSVLIQLYNLFTRFNITRNYITGNHMLKPSEICFELISPTFVSDLYDLTWGILHLIFVVPYCKFITTLVKLRVITNGPLYGIYYLYAVLLSSMTLSPAFKLIYSTLEVVVSSFTILVDYILINLRLLSLMY